MKALPGIAAADLIIRGRVHTVDAANTVAEACAVAGDRIVAIGRWVEVAALRKPTTTVIDAGSATVMPGIFDSHNHIVAAGRMMDGVMLFDAGSIADLQVAVAARARQLEPGSWVEGGGWIESQFAEYRLPTRHDLDEAAPDHPVVLHRLFGMVVANSRALALAGIDASTPDPPRGRIDRDPATGEPTGVLRSGAAQLLAAVRPHSGGRRGLEGIKEAILRAGKEYLRWGITSAIDPGVSPAVARAYQELYREGWLPLRVNLMPAWHGMYAGGAADRDLNGLGVSSGFGDEWLSLGAVKMAIDGGLGSRTALLNWPLTDGSLSTEPLRLDVSRLGDYFGQVHGAGWSVGIHCCGDRAQDLACRAFAAVARQEPRADARHNIVHAYFATPGALALMVEHGIGVSVQPGFMFVEGDIYYDSVDARRLESYQPLRTYLDRGIVVAANSDMTSAHYNPFLGMRAALNRQTAKGRTLGTEEAVNREEMLRLFTINGAYLAFADGRVGSLEVGKLADIAVLSDDIMAMDTGAVGDLTVRLTVLGGRIVHQQAT
jgi:predicted amidohydrolase YtcJ